MKWLINNVLSHNPLLTKHQRERYSRLEYGVTNKINRFETNEEYQKFIFTSYSKVAYSNDPIFNWISGFINGEGSFIISPKGKLIFYIEQAESEVLELIKTRLELGPNISFRKKRGENRKDTYSLAISSKKDIKALIEFFSNKDLAPLQGNKNRQYEEWIKQYVANSHK